MYIVILRAALSNMVASTYVAIEHLAINVPIPTRKSTELAQQYYSKLKCAVIINVPDFKDLVSKFKKKGLINDSFILSPS